MEYEGQICRGPMERASYMLPISVGCSYNQCRFCMLFKHLKYRELPLEQIEAELHRISAIGGNPKQVFLGDGNAFSAGTERLLTILDMVHRSFPACEAVHMDATVHDILRKPEAELAALSEAGVRTLYLGIECGLDDVLARMNKGQTMAQAEAAIEKLHQAGMRYGAHMMTGIAGKDRGLEMPRPLRSFLIAPVRTGSSISPSSCTAAPRCIRIFSPGSLLPPMNWKTCGRSTGFWSFWKQSSSPTTAFTTAFSSGCGAVCPMTGKRCSGSWRPPLESTRKRTLYMPLCRSTKGDFAGFVSGGIGALAENSYVVEKRPRMLSCGGAFYVTYVAEAAICRAVYRFQTC